MNTLSMNTQLKSFHIEKNVRSLKKKINTNHHHIKTYVEILKEQNKKKTAAFEWLLLSNYFLEMNDFGGAIIK